MHNKAFAWISSLGPAGDGTHNVSISATCVVLNEDDEVITVGSGGSAVFNHTSNFQTIHEVLADNIRDNNSDPNLVVTFVDSPGRF